MQLWFSIILKSTFTLNILFCPGTPVIPTSYWEIQKLVKLSYNINSNLWVINKCFLWYDLYQQNAGCSIEPPWWRQMYFLLQNTSVVSSSVTAIPIFPCHCTNSNSTVAAKPQVRLLCFPFCFNTPWEPFYMHVLSKNTQRGCESKKRGCKAHVNCVGYMTFPTRISTDCQVRVSALL